MRRSTVIAATVAAALPIGAFAVVLNGQSNSIDRLNARVAETQSVSDAQAARIAEQDRIIQDQSMAISDLEGQNLGLQADLTKAHAKDGDLIPDWVPIIGNLDGGDVASAVGGAAVVGAAACAASPFLTAFIPGGGLLYGYVACGAGIL